MNLVIKKKSSNTLGFEESPNNSDENDVIDSEPELELPHKSSIEVYKDHSISPTKIQSPAKHRTPIKRIDLGAAAHYGKTQTVINSPVATNNPLDIKTSSVDLLNIVDNSNKQSNDFGDFNAVFSAYPSTDSTVKKNSSNDEFADFSSAFTTQSMSLNSNPTNLSNQNIISNSDLLTSLPQSSTNGTNRNLLDLNFDTLDNTGSSLPLNQMIQPVSFAQNSNPENKTSGNLNTLQLGNTWSGVKDLNIDLDNLLSPGGKSPNSMSMSMNQMANNNNSLGGKQNAFFDSNDVLMPTQQAFSASFK